MAVDWDESMECPNCAEPDEAEGGMFDWVNGHCDNCGFDHEEQSNDKP